MLLAFEPITKCNRFKLHSDSIHNGNHWPCFEYKYRQHREELVNCQRIVAVQQHIPTPVTHSYDEQLDLEIVGRLPLSENLQYPLLGILVLHRRPLRTFGPTDHVLHRYPPLFELKSPERLLEQQPCTRLGFVDKSAHGAELPIRHVRSYGEFRISAIADRDDRYVVTVHAYFDRRAPAHEEASPTRPVGRHTRIGQPDAGRRL